jgi:crotonobetainyl-CoA:carnitine CoA-transferase CaiB-like acyl-CoA transferase
MGMADLIGDPRYASNASRCAHADDLDAAMAAWFRARDCDDIMRLFDAAHVVAGPVVTIADIVQDPHYAARSDIVSVPDDDFGTVRMQGVVPRFAATPGEVRHAGRGLGADNRAIYLDRIGLDAAELARLTEAGVI